MELCSVSEGRKPGGLRHRDEEVGAGPDGWRAHQKGLVWAAFEAQLYCLGPEGFLPEETPHLWH